MTFVLYLFQWDVYFTASPPKASNTTLTNGQSTGPPSPKIDQYDIYKISVYALMGQFLSPPPTMKIPADEPLPPQLLLSCTDEEDGAREQIRRVSTELPSAHSPPRKETIARTRSSPLPLYFFDSSAEKLWTRE